MARIVINEIDNTTAGISAVETDVVYVPGFMSVSSTDYAEGDKELLALDRAPTLCRTIREFETLFGKHPAALNDVPSSGLLYSNLSLIRDVEHDLSSGDITKTSTKLNVSFTPTETVTEGTTATISIEWEETSGGTTIHKTATKTATYSSSKFQCSVDISGTVSNESGKIKYKAKDTSGYEGNAVAFEGGAKDPSYIYAKELINLGIPVLYESMNTYNSTSPKGASVSDMYSILASAGGPYSVLEDKGEFDIKYLTSGGYPIFELFSNGITAKMVNAAKERGDCVAVIDHVNDPQRPLVGDDSVYAQATTYAKSITDSDKATMFTPWANFVPVTLYSADYSSYVSLPPSYSYLSAMAVSLRTNASWLAVAGAARGSIPNLYSDKPMNIGRSITNAIAEEEYQKRDDVSINAITKINPYGYRIWGNRTLKNNSVEGNLTATSFLNIRNMVSDVKKVAYTACKRLMFEQNNDVLWANFKAAVEPTLDRMKSGSGISGYKVIKNETLEKAKLVATIKLYPVYAVEDFEITVTMEDDEVSVS